jgi:hypothetical protein
VTLEEFRRLADTWGGDIARWPAPRRVEARRRATTEEGASILADAQGLDALLATPPDVSPERAARAAVAVVQRIAAEGQARQGARRFAYWRLAYWRLGNWQLRYWLIPAASLACSALIGISLATRVPFGHPDEPTSVLGAILDSGSMAASWVTQ